MAKHHVNGSVTKYIDESYSGSVLQAVERCREENPGIQIESIDGKTVVGWCEVCECPLFEGSKYYMDGEGTGICKKHLP